MPARPDLWQSLPPIGKPIANARIYILDNLRQPVPIGVPGTLYIGGVCVARGYRNQPDLTAERFITNPFSNEPTARLYNTGDRCRWLEDGNIEYLGRSDNQVKIRGFRIEPGEIESTLETHPAVRQAVVAVQDDGGHKRLVAYVVQAQEQGVTNDSLREHLKGQLPDYMVPSFIATVDTLPVTPSGKVDRNSLPTVEFERPAEQEIVAPATDTEAKLAEIWKAALKVKSIGIHDNFFDLGGHSLLAVRLFDRIRREFDLELPLAAIFEGPTVAQLAKVIDTPRKRGLLVPIQKNGSGTPLFCVHGIGGEVLSFEPVTRHLGEAFSVYGIRALGILEGETPDTSIVRMAERYVDEIRTVCPDGPFRLLGYSSGGTIAYEMAKQINRAGLRVDWLGILDTFLPHVQAYSRGAKRAWQIMNNLPWWLYYDLKESNLKELLIRLRGKLRRKGQDKSTKQSAPELNVEEVFGVTNLPAWMEPIAKTHYRALFEYQPEPYDGGITLFKSRARPLMWPGDRLLGWEQMVRGNIDLRVVPGDHYSFLHEPHVRKLAEAVRSSLS